ncbi:MAG: ATPase, partial [Firmicutes bacterium]|nr:ATPase [Bacillota bacterium]
MKLTNNTFLGIELGSTRIKSVLIDQNHALLASGSHEWENALVDGVWTYSLEDVWAGLQSSFRDLSQNVEKQYGTPLKSVKAIGVS